MTARALWVSVSSPLPASRLLFFGCLYAANEIVAFAQLFFFLLAYLVWDFARVAVFQIDFPQADSRHPWPESRQHLPETSIAPNGLGPFPPFHTIASSSPVQ